MDRATGVPRICSRTAHLVGLMPLDTEIMCATHGKESVLHYDHESKQFKCMQCIPIEKMNEMSTVVETDRRVIMKGMHVLKEVMLAKIKEIQDLVSHIDAYTSYQS